MQKEQCPHLHLLGEDGDPANSNKTSKIEELPPKVQPRPYLVGGGEAAQLEAESCSKEVKEQGVQPHPHPTGGREAVHHQLRYSLTPTLLVE